MFNLCNLIHRRDAKIAEINFLSLCRWEDGKEKIISKFDAIMVLKYILFAPLLINDDDISKGYIFISDWVLFFKRGLFLQITYKPDAFLLLASQQQEKNMDSSACGE